MSRKLRSTTDAPARGGPDPYREMFAVSQDDAGSTLPTGLPEQTIGWSVLEWISDHLVNPDTLEPWLLTREQARLVLWWYAHDAALRPVFTRGELVRAKGAFKSPIAATLALVEACGPCRPGPDGTAVPASSPLIQVSGVAEDSTEPALDFVRRLAKASPTLRIDVGLGRLVTAAGAVIEGITASPWTAEGARPSLVIAEESQHWTASNRGHELYRVLTRNVAKNPDGWARVFSTTNRHEPGLESVAERNWEAHTLGLPGLLYDCREAPADVNLADRADVLRALRIAYGDSWWAPLERIADEAPLTLESVYRRFYLNHLTHAVDAWLDANEWDVCVVPEVAAEPGDAITLGFDGSLGRSTGTADATALIGCRVADGFLFPIAIWEQPPGPEGEGWTVPVDDVRAEFRDAFRTWTVVGFGADPAGWEGIVADWEAEHGPRLKVKAGATTVAYRFNRTGIVVRDTLALHDAIVNQEVRLSDVPVFRRHALNARRQASHAGIQLRKDHPQSARKIDGIVAAVIAYAVALDARRGGLDRPEPTFVPYRIR